MPLIRLLHGRLPSGSSCVQVDPKSSILQCTYRCEFARFFVGNPSEKKFGRLTLLSAFKICPNNHPKNHWICPIYLHLKLADVNSVTPVHFHPYSLFHICTKSVDSRFNSLVKRWVLWFKTSWWIHILCAFNSIPSRSSNCYPLFPQYYDYDELLLKEKSIYQWWENDQLRLVLVGFGLATCIHVSVANLMRFIPVDWGFWNALCTGLGDGSIPIWEWFN